MELENASISLAAARDILERDGQAMAARTLRGIEVNGPSDASAAIQALQEVEAKTFAASAALAFAIGACRKVGAPAAAA
jgi:hypothetical protein